MAKYMMMLCMVFVVFLTDTISISLSDSVSIVFVVLPLNKKVSISHLSASLAEKNLPRVHRRDLDGHKPTSEEQELKKHKPNDDLETAAGTNVLRPLFVYRQQLAYRDRNNKRFAEERRAIPDQY